MQRTEPLGSVGCRVLLPSRSQRCPPSGAAAISGATLDTYTTAPTTTADNGASFTATVANASGTATSNAAVLTVSGCTNPGVPGVPTFTNVAATSLRVNWTAVPNAIGYIVYRYNGQITFQAVSPQLAATARYFDDSALVSSYRYVYKIFAVAATGCVSQMGPYANVTTLAGACTTLPGVPRMGYSKPGNGATAVVLAPRLERWGTHAGDVVNATSFDVQVATDAGFTNIVRSANTGCYCNYWLVSPALASGTKYYWRVRSKNACGVSGWGSVFSFTTAY